MPIRQKRAVITAPINADPEKITALSVSRSTGEDECQLTRGSFIPARRLTVSEVSRPSRSSSDLAHGLVSTTRRWPMPFLEVRPARHRPYAPHHRTGALGSPGQTGCGR